MPFALRNGGRKFRTAKIREPRDELVMSAFAPRFFAGLKHLRHCTIHGDSQSVNVLANHFVRPARTPGILKVHFGLHFIESVVSKRRTLVLELLASSSSSLQSYFLTNHVIGHVDRRLREIRNHFSAADFSPECWTTSSESCVSVAPSAAKSELQQRFRASEKDRPQDYESKKSELQQRFRASEKDRSQDHESTNALPAISLAVAFTGASAGCTFCDANESEDSIKLQPPPRPVSFQDLLSVLGHWDWMLLLAAILLTLLHTVFSLAIPTTFSAVMNACREKLDLAVPIRTFVFLQGVVILLDGGKHFILGILGERIRQKLRVQLYASLLRQEIAYFDFNARGELFSLLGEDVHRIQQCLTDQILGFLTAVATLVYGGYKVVTISPKATVLVLLSFPILSIANLLAQGSCRKKAQEVIAASRSNLSMASEVLSNPRTVQAFGAESREAARYAESLQKQYSLECDYRAYTGLAHLAFSGINTLLSAAGLWYGAWPRITFCCSCSVHLADGRAI